MEPRPLIPLASAASPALNRDLAMARRAENLTLGDLLLELGEPKNVGRAR